MSGVHDNCQDCDDFTSENIIKPRLLATCDGMWSVTLEVCVCVCLCVCWCGWVGVGVGVGVGMGVCVGVCVGVWVCVSVYSPLSFMHTHCNYIL